MHITLTLDPVVERMLQTLAQRQSLSLEEAAYWALKAGLQIQYWPAQEYDSTHHVEFLGSIDLQARSRNGVFYMPSPLFLGLEIPPRELTILDDPTDTEPPHAD